jgi:hypothetical protein
MKRNTAQAPTFRVFDSAGVLVTGLLDAAFTKTWTADGVATSVSATITEVTTRNGEYAVAFTSPDAVIGVLDLCVTHATYNPQGYNWQWPVNTNDEDSIPAAVWAVGTRTLSSFGTLVADIALAVWNYTETLITAGIGLRLKTDIDMKLSDILTGEMGGVLEGTIQLYITGGTTPIAGAQVVIYDATNVNPLASGTTGAGGTVVFDTFAAGAYKVRMSLPGAYTFTTGTATVTVDKATYTFYGTAISIPTAADPDKCTLYGYTKDSQGVVRAGKKVEWRLFQSPQIVSTVHVHNDWQSVLSGADGAFSFTVYRGIDIQVKIDGEQIPDAGRVPAAASATLASVFSDFVIQA